MTFMDGHSLHVTIVRPLLLLLGSILLRGKQQQTHTKLLIFLIFFGERDVERSSKKGYEAYAYVLASAYLSPVQEFGNPRRRHLFCCSEFAGLKEKSLEQLQLLYPLLSKRKQIRE